MMGFTALLYGITFGLKAGIIVSIITTSFITIVGVLEVTGLLPATNLEPNYLSSSSAWLTQGSVYLLLTFITILSLGTLLKGLNRYFINLKKQADELKATNDQLKDEIIQNELYATELDEKKEWYRLLSENISEVIFIQDLNLNITYVSPSIESFVGYTPAEVVSMEMKDFLTQESLERALKDFEKYLALAKNEKITIPLLEYQYIRKNRSIAWGELKPVFLYDTNGNISGVQGILRDITKRKKTELEKDIIEERLRQSEKMQAIGHLAGGIAHDFNNQLTGILGNAQLILLEHHGDKQLKTYSEEIIKSANSSTALISKLLLFARKSEMDIIDTNVHNVIDEAVSILSRSINKNIEVRKVLRAIVPTTKADPIQLLNGLLNIGINARDAMPDGGELVFTTDNIVIDDDDYHARQQDPVKGPCILITISDTGTGIPEDTITHIFEPFYTTKETGTGMGLASVYGMVKTHKGYIEVSSNTGQGTSFSIYLPVYQKTELIQAKKPDTAFLNKTCHVLLVDDEDVARDATKNLLKFYNIKVTDFKSANKALSYYWEHHKEVDIVILDQIMPDMNGSEILLKMHGINPEVKCIFISGYRFDTVDTEAYPYNEHCFIQKPFTLETIYKSIIELLKA
ncbi:MAG: PAS domain S-box protein [Spirochaetales bacterium]|nr:PAS domain S-box protein [Spirochaetales bacterium]